MNRRDFCDLNAPDVCLHTVDRILCRANIKRPSTDPATHIILSSLFFKFDFYRVFLKVGCLLSERTKLKFSPPGEKKHTPPTFTYPADNRDFALLNQAPIKLLEIGGWVCLRKVSNAALPLRL